MNSNRKRIDWDEEIRKTERIKRRGMLISALSLALACALIFGAGKVTGTDIEIPRAVIVAVCFFVSCVIFRSVIRHRAERRNKSKEHHDD
ncbi:MAG: hypothetical protein IJR35_05010 [Synergistaceae bacterium]|nr:hypothetical protein [Synergistaceae bacterium]MBQ9595201.1 hypothetical protein [Synergistaceae bacterium]